MKTHEITTMIRQLQDEFESEVMAHDGEITDAAQALEDVLNDTKATAVDKVVSIKRVADKLNAKIAGAVAQADYYKEQADRFSRVAKSASVNVAYLKTLVVDLMNAAGEKAIDDDRGNRVSLVETEAIEVQDMGELYAAAPQLCRVKIEADKKAIKDQYKALGILPVGVTILKNQSVRGL